MTPTEFLERHAPPPARIRTQHDQMNLEHIERDFPAKCPDCTPATCLCLAVGKANPDCADESAEECA